jgi:hypothetical protein
MSQPDDWGIRVHQITPRAVIAAPRWRHLSLILLVSIFGVRAAAADPPALDVTVAAVQGEVHVTSQARPLDLHKGDVMPLPATIYTGPSGSIELRQGNTTVSAAPNSELVIPAPAVPGEAIDRVIQSRGNAFYNVAKRGASKLHVESAYLVAVIKGTQFSVVAQDDSATISLFEGRLEVRATDGSDVVDLHAGEIAVRHANDSAIRMLRMDTAEPVAHRALPGSAAPSGGEAGDLREASAGVGSESTAHGTNGASSWGGTSLGSGVGATPGSGSTSVGDIVAANLGNKSANGNSGGNGHNANDGSGQGTPNNGNGQGGAGNNGNGQSASNNGNGQGAGNNGNGQGASGTGNGHGVSNNGNGQGAGNNGNGQSGSNNGNGQSAGNNGNGQSASSNGNGQSSGNNGNGPSGSNNGNGQSAGNNGNGQSSGNNGNGPSGSNNGNGQSASNSGNGQNSSNNGNGQSSNGNGNGNGNGQGGAGNNGNGRPGSNKAVVRSLNIGRPDGLVASGTFNRGITSPLTQTTGANLGTGAPAGGVAVGGLLGSMTRHKGSSVQP